MVAPYTALRPPVWKSHIEIETRTSHTCTETGHGYRRAQLRHHQLSGDGEKKKKRRKKGEKKAAPRKQ